MTNQYIELNRTFRILPADYTDLAEHDQIDISRALELNVKEDIEWDNLVEKYRTIILSEAGTGKTEEIRQMSLKLRAEGKPAFFLRLEHIPDFFDIAFEEGSNDEFQSWLESEKEGWLLLDSVDESKLKDPKDFDRAIKIISSKIKPALSRIHILITGRTSFWKPKSDLDLCNRWFPDPTNKSTSATDDEPSDTSPDEDIENIDTNENNAKKKTEGFGVYSLTELSEEQIEIFIQAKGITDVSNFLDEIERNDARAHTTRPQDLEELAEFWIENGKLGSRFEIINNSIERRLKERDQDRAVSETISAEKLLQGAKLLAAATTLMHESTISVPDGSSSIQGINASSILSDWTEKESGSLLGRPIFDEAIYGTVRFHHRSVREFLTARWLTDVLSKEGSRRMVEALFFREQYGIHFVVPSMNPVLSWMIIFDEKIREKVRKIRPEAIFECADPGRLPLELRRSILQTVCKNISSDETSRSEIDYTSVQRFADVGLAEDIKELIEQYKHDSELTYLLIRMVWQGQMIENLPEAKSFALDPLSENYTRIAAIRAVNIIGDDVDFIDVMQAIANQESKVRRRILAEILEFVDVSDESIDWLFKVIENLEEIETYSATGLGRALGKFIDRLDDDLTAQFVKHVEQLLNRGPVIEKRHCEVSEQFSWLLGCGVQAVKKLIISRNSAALETESLTILIKAPISKDYLEYGFKFDHEEFAYLVRGWPELNYRLFWHHVETSRLWLDNKKSERLTDWWILFYRLWHFETDDFELITSDIIERDFIDDKLVALSLAFQLYIENERPRKWRDTLKRIAASHTELQSDLHLRLNPPALTREQKASKRESAQFEQRRKKRKEQRENEKFQFKAWLNQNYETLRDNKCLKKEKLLNAHIYLHDNMRKLRDDSLSWNWTDLIDEYGQNVAEAFKDGAINFWRNNTPKFQSENEQYDRNIYSLDIFGLTGITIESNENPDWINALEDHEIELVCRYAFSELNTFPPWFESFYEKYSSEINKYILQEVEWELNASEEHCYIINKVVNHSVWLYEGLSNDFLKFLYKEPNRLKSLDDLLTIIQSSASISDAEIIKLASKKCKVLHSPDHLSRWYAVWVGVEPEAAINSFVEYLENISDLNERKGFVMKFVVNLIGERRTDSKVRDNYNTPEYLKWLYLLVLEYVKPDEDIHRTGTGAYTPELRDDAQEARERIFAILRDIPGKRTYLAISVLSQSHPVESSKPWMKHNARLRAINDADDSPLSLEQFNDFSREIEFTPNNHHQLFLLAEHRLYDLKDELENGDGSNATILQEISKEVKIRNYIGNWCRDRAAGKYSIPQEEELADAKKPDLRFHSSTFDAPVPVELKLVDNWSGPKLFERLENQLCGDYLRDSRSKRGVFLLVFRGDKQHWDIPPDNQKVNFVELISALRARAQELVASQPDIDVITVIEIDLTLRSA